MSNCAIVSYFYQPMKVVCDGNCAKAWGISVRPMILLSDNPDDSAFLADGELGEAPVNPGTYEGGEGKPSSPSEFPNKWCVRECERCARSKPGKQHEPLEPFHYDKRVYNMPQLHNGE